MTTLTTSSIVYTSVVVSTFGLVAYLARKRHRSTTTNEHIVDLVRSSCAYAAETLKDIVQIHMDELKKLSANQLLADPPQWDEFEWHCSRDKYGDNLTARYVFVLDALNYCFWPSTSKTGLEYEHLARGLKKACDAGETFLDLDQASEERVKSWLEAPHEFPQFQTRLEAIRSLGRVLKQYGDAVEWLKQSNHSAVTLVDMIVKRLPHFKDESVLHGRRICFYKRAQILVADLWAAFGQRSSGFGGFNDIDRLTIFADYRVPQLMRDLGILTYRNDLSTQVDSRQEIPRNSDQEIAIRAASVHAVELLKQFPVQSGQKRQLISVEVDWLLWQRGEALKDQLRPHHRTLTTCY